MSWGRSTKHCQADHRSSKHLYSEVSRRGLPRLFHFRNLAPFRYEHTITARIPSSGSATFVVQFAASENWFLGASKSSPMYRALANLFSFKRGHCREVQDHCVFASTRRVACATRLRADRGLSASASPQEARSCI